MAFICQLLSPTTEKSMIARLDAKDRQFIQDIGTLFLAE
jgi:hypothetical protein